MSLLTDETTHKHEYIYLRREKREREREREVKEKKKERDKGWTDHNPSQVSKVLRSKDLLLVA